MSVRFAPATEPMSAPMTVPGTNPQSTFLFLISLAVDTTVPVVMMIAYLSQLQRVLVFLQTYRLEAKLDLPHLQLNLQSPLERLTDIQ